MSSFADRRLKRKLRKRESELRTAASTVIDFHLDDQTHHTVITRKFTQSFDCGFCHRKFMSYPALLNHRCDDQ